MAKGLKSAGVEELRAFRRRVIRQHSLERISKTDKDKLVDLVDQLEAHIVYMSEAIDDYEYEREV